MRLSENEKRLLVNRFCRKKSRRDALDLQGKLYRSYSNLPEICMSLRAGVNGSAEEWEPCDIVDMLDMLQYRLDTWVSSIRSREHAVDECVRHLVEATITEVKSYEWWQQ